MQIKDLPYELWLCYAYVGLCYELFKIIVCNCALVILELLRTSLYAIVHWVMFLIGLICFQLVWYELNCYGLIICNCEMNVDNTWTVVDWLYAFVLNCYVDCMHLCWTWIVMQLCTRLYAIVLTKLCFEIWN